jgi:hypothetical protein
MKQFLANKSETGSVAKKRFKITPASVFNKTCNRFHNFHWEWCNVVQDFPVL